MQSNSVDLTPSSDITWYNTEKIKLHKAIKHMKTSAGHDRYTGKATNNKINQKLSMCEVLLT